MAVLSSLKSRLILVISGTITVLLIILFMAIVSTSRAILIQNEVKYVKAITRTFSVVVLDIIIAGQNSPDDDNFFLENYILDFMNKDSSIRYISILDADNNLLATSDFTLFSREQADQSPSAAEPMITFLPEGKGPEVINCVYPMQTGNKRWGTLIMGFDAAPLQREIRTLFIMLAGVAIILVVALLFMLYMMISGLTKSLTELSEAVGKIDFESEEIIPLEDSGDEVGILVQAFHQLQYRLQASKKDFVEVQKQVHHAEKLASVGRLASGIAHEINNPLNGIKNCIHTIIKEPENAEQATAYLQLVNEGLDHIETIVRKLLGFARKTTGPQEPTDVGGEIQKILTLLDYKFTKKSISVINDISPDLPFISGHPPYIQEVFMNLIINSVDAVEHGGEIRLESRVGGDRLAILVHDNGSGIDAEHLATIFDPFFTTKQLEMGTGLGLSVALGIVESYGGSIICESKINEGTTFTVTFPIRTEQ